MKKLLLLLIPIGILLAQTSGRYLLPIWSGNHYVWAQLGDGLAINGGVLDVKPAPGVTIGAKPVWDASAGGYRLPVTPTQVAVYVNGLRYTEGIDYTLQGALIVPTANNWPGPADAVVTVDYQ